MNLKKLKELTQNLSVLYVEDDEDILNTMSVYLKKFFSLVICAKDGLEGLQKYQEQSFDIVLTDLSMPKMNGLEMIQKIKDLDKNQAILITTAHSESHYMHGAIQAHIDGYIIKPFDYEQLNDELFKIADRLQKFKENEKYKTDLKEMVDEKTSKLRELIDFQSENYDKTLFSMIEMIEQRDTYTAGHSKRVAKYSKMIAQEMGYSKKECDMIHQAGFLHDVGKIGTPDSVLLNPKKLNDIEYKLIQEHVEVSYKLLKNIPMFEPLAEMVYSHHERYDGQGYPRGLKADEITPFARILIVADAFDAMTTNRIYKARKSVPEALDELEELVLQQFHPEVVEKAVIALKDVTIDDKISQLPQTRLEEERFAYFYKDTLSEVYNHSYLDVVLMKNSYDKKYSNMEIFFINGFSNYNKLNGWNKGNEFLKDFANTINDNTDTLVFRVFGDDFVVLSKEKLELSDLREKLDILAKENGLSYRVKSIDLDITKIENSSQVENV